MQEPARAVWTGGPCKPPCRPAPPATRWNARYWTRSQNRGQRVWNLLGSRACPLHHRLHHLAGDPEAMAVATARRRTGRCSNQTRRRRRRKADRGGARGRPRSELIVDANEAWTADDLERILGGCAGGVTLVEQPLPAGRDAALARQRAARRLRRRKRARSRHRSTGFATATMPSTSNSTRPAA